MYHKLAYETIFSYTFCDWFSIWSNSHFDQLAGSSHAVKKVISLFQCFYFSRRALFIIRCLFVFWVRPFCHNRTMWHKHRTSVAFTQCRYEKCKGNETCSVTEQEGTRSEVIRILGILWTKLRAKTACLVRLKVWPSHHKYTHDSNLNMVTSIPFLCYMYVFNNSAGWPAVLVLPITWYQQNVCRNTYSVMGDSTQVNAVPKTLEVTKKYL